MGKLIDKEDEVIEMVFSEKELNELIDKLEGLKEDKQHVHFYIRNNNQLLIHHENDEQLK